MQNAEKYIGLQKYKTLLLLLFVEIKKGS